MGAKILVTGASGFVGSALCCRLDHDGWIVRAVARDLNRLETVSYTHLTLPTKRIV